MTWQILTKRPQRIKQWLPEDWGEGYPNVWLGTSVESPKYYNRILRLVEVPSGVHFLSCEPLLEPLPLIPIADIEWVIVGGESGKSFRPMSLEWVREIKQQCDVWSIPFFFKQPAGFRTELSAILDGREWKAMPNVQVPLNYAKVI